MKKKIVIVAIAIIVVLTGVVASQVMKPSTTAEGEINAPVSQTITIDDVSKEKKHEIKVTPYNEYLKRERPGEYSDSKQTAKPKNTELNQEKAATTIFDNIKDFFPKTDVSEGELVMLYIEPDGKDDNAEWKGTYKNDKNEFELEVYVHAETGAFLEGYKCPIADKSHVDVKPIPTDREFSKYLKSTEYTKRVEKYVKELFPEKKITKVENLRIGETFGGNEKHKTEEEIYYFNVDTVATFSDGTGFAVQLGIRSYDVYTVFSLNNPKRMDIHLNQ